MKTLCLFLALCPLLTFGNDTKTPSVITAVTVYLNGANITRTAQCSLPEGTSEITLTGLSTEIDESSIQLSGLRSVSILSMSYDLNFNPIPIATTVSDPLLDRLERIALEIAALKNNIAGLEEEERVIQANREVSARNQALSLEKIKEIGAYYRQRITAIKNEIFSANLSVKKLDQETRALQKQLAELNNAPEQERGEINITFDAPVATSLDLEISYQVQGAGWIPNYDITSNKIDTPLSLKYKAHVYQKTGNDWDNVTITLSTGNPNINMAKPNLGAKYLNFTNGYQNTVPRAAKKKKYVYNPSVRKVTGTVVDESGAPLPGATVLIKGTSEGTQTDFDGHFSLSVQKGQELVVSYLGFHNEELPIYSSVMNIRLDESASQLDEVIVTGYGKSQSERFSSVVGFEQALAGRVSGVAIRGASSVGREQTPLYVVDGVVVEGFMEGDIDSDTIQAVETLTGANARTIYGSRGSNGVVVITTKKSTVEDTLTNTKFVIKKPYSIASDGDIVAIEINTFQLDAKYEYFAAPIVNEHVFLTSTFQNWEKYKLLPGEASIYFKGSYAGKTTIDPYTTKKEMTVSLGIEQNITVTRKQRKNFKAKSFTGSNRILNRAYDITVKNNTSAPIDLKLVDRIPISQNKDIKVSEVTTHTAAYDTKKGLLAWKLQLSPQQSKTEGFSFQVKYPKYKRISI